MLRFSLLILRWKIKLRSAFFLQYLPQSTASNWPEFGAEFLIELALALYQLGAEQMDLPHNFWVGLTCWVVALFIAIRMFWIFPPLSRFLWPGKTLVTLLAIWLFAVLEWNAVLNAYREKHPFPDNIAMIPSVPLRLIPAPPAFAFLKSATLPKAPISALQSQLKPKIVRLGLGPDAYKDLSAVQVGQWAIDESEKMEKLSEEMTAPRGPLPPEAQQFFFQATFNQCCEQDLQELRAEILRRLGPPGKDSDEISAWTILFPQTRYPDIPKRSDSINPGSVSRYAPYLRRMGVQLRHTEIPRIEPKILNFSQANSTEKRFNMPYNIEVTTQVKTKVTSGYLVVEFNSPPGGVMCDMAGSKYAELIDRKLIDNSDVREYLDRREIPKYAVAIRGTPLTPDKPIHVFMAGKEASLKAVKVTLFDE